MDDKCWCEYVDIGVGEQRVTDNPECPEHNPQQEEGRSMDIENEIYRVLGRITDVDPHERLESASELVDLIRAVVRDELAKAAETAKVTEPGPAQVEMCSAYGSRVAHNTRWYTGPGGTLPEHCAVCGRLKADPEPDSIFQPVEVKPLWAGACVRCGQTGRHAASCTTGRWRDVLDRASGTSVVITGPVRDMVITRGRGSADGIRPACDWDPNCTGPENCPDHGKPRCPGCGDVADHGTRCIGF